MTPHLTRIRRLITEFKFKPLFVEELGWEDLRSAPLTVTVDGQSFTLRGVAEKRGLLLLQCDALPPYAMRRKIDQEVTWTTSSTTTSSIGWGRRMRTGRRSRRRFVIEFMHLTSGRVLSQGWRLWWLAIL